MRPYDTELASGEASDGFDTPNFPPHIQAAIDAGPRYMGVDHPAGNAFYESPAEFATRIAGMVAEWKDSKLSAARAELAEAVAAIGYAHTLLEVENKDGKARQHLRAVLDRIEAKHGGGR